MHFVARVLLVVGFARGGTLLRDPVPLREYYSRTLLKYKDLSWRNITRANAAPMLRVQNLEDDDFKELVRRGYPFIVDDCAPAEVEMRNVPCAEFGRRWPKEHMRAEYTPGQHHINLEDRTWYSVQKPTATAPKHISLGKPLSGPYIWHVKDETEDPSTKPEIMKMFHVPYFLNQSTLNANEARDSFEFWFVLENGGSQAHADAYCETTISLQLQGKKVWRLGAFPNITNAFEPHAFHDGEIYQSEEYWKPEHEETVDAGQCVVFPMGYIHETYVHEGSAGQDGCSVATTFQFQDPQPVHMWKNFLTRWGLSHYGRDEPCMERMRTYVYLGKERQFGGKPLDKLREVFSELDLDGDGKLARSEVAKAYAASTRYRPPWTEVQDRVVLTKAAAEKLEWRIDDALLFHDADSDGQITLEEMGLTASKFQAVMERLHHIQEAKSQVDLFHMERSWIRQHLCENDDCVALKQLEADFNRISKGSRPAKGRRDEF